MHVGRDLSTQPNPPAPFFPQPVAAALSSGFGRGQCPHQAELGGYAFDAVGRVDVFDQGDLIARR